MSQLKTPEISNKYFWSPGMHVRNLSVHHINQESGNTQGVDIRISCQNILYHFIQQSLTNYRFAPYINCNSSTNWQAATGSVFSLTDSWKTSHSSLGRVSNNQNGNLRWFLPLLCPLNAQISRNFLPHFFSFAIESYIYEMDFTLKKYHF